MRDLLRKGVCQVVFAKADGSTRKMLCTLNSDYIGVESAGTSVPDPEDTVTVWDVEAEGWRRFKPSRLLEDIQPV